MNEKNKQFSTRHSSLSIRTPAIRFKGFSGEWEKRELKDVSESFEYGLNAAATEYDGQNKYIRITDINEDSHTFSIDDLTSPNTDLNLAENYKLNLGDILFARTGASVGKTYIYKEEDGLVYYAGFLIRARVKQEVNAEFIFQNTLTEKYNKFIRLTSQRSGQPGVNAQEYSNYSITIPSKDEQTKIGSYFQQLDTLITQHQRKHDKLLNVKKAMLEKMFPKKGAEVPEIRFKGFSEKWGERKLGDVADTFSGGTPQVGNKEYYNGEIPFIRSAEINSDSTALFISEIGLKSSSAKLINIGCILYALYGATSGEVGCSKIKGAINQAVLAITPNHEFSTEFIMQWLRKNKKEIISTYLQGGQGNLSGAIVKSLNIGFPTYEEQTKIGSFFKHLDTLLSLHQTELEKLKNIKKACLEKMFV